MRKLLALSVLAFALGAGPAHAILNGVPDGSDHPYVGMVSKGSAICSGTRLSAHTFLTAGHCFAQGSSVEIVFAENGRDRSLVYTGTFTRSFAGDVAIVVVNEAMPAPYAELPALGAAAALPMRQSVVSVGYGLQVAPKDFSSGSQVRLRYQASSELIQESSSSSGSYLKLSANPAQGKGGVCFGDSGGPTLIGDTIVGITAGGPNGNCAGVTYAQRVDTAPVRAFIDGFTP